MSTIKVFFLISLLILINSCKDSNNNNLVKKNKTKHANKRKSTFGNFKKVKEKCITIDFQNQKFLYRGFGYFYIYLNGISSENVFYRSKRAHGIVKNDNRGYKIWGRGFKKDELDTIKVYKQIDKDTVLLATKAFRWLDFPTPIVRLGHFSGIGDTIDKSLLIAQYGISSRYAGPYYHLSLTYRVVYFVLSFNVEGVTYETISNSGKFTKEQKMLMKKLNSGDKVYIEDIRVRGKTYGKYYKLPIMMFIIK